MTDPKCEGQEGRKPIDLSTDEGKRQLAGLLSTHDFTGSHPEVALAWLQHNVFPALAASEQKRAALEAALREVEWVVVETGERAHCPSCKRWKGYSHAENCRTQEALAGGTSALVKVVERAKRDGAAEYLETWSAEIQPDLERAKILASGFVKRSFQRQIDDLRERAAAIRQGGGDGK